MKRSLVALFFLFWTGILLGVYYVVQKPGLLSAFAGLIDTGWTLLVTALLLFNAYGLGTQIVGWLGPKSIHEVDRILLGSGIGLGSLALLSLIVSLLQIARAPVFVFLIAFLTAIFLSRRIPGQLLTDLKELITDWHLSFSQFDFFSKAVILLPFLFSFLLTLAPQFEAFDALLYHLAQPAWVLQDGGLRPVDIPPFWFPTLTENVYLWALALGSERAPQLIHWIWMTCSALLVWRWSVKIWSRDVGRKTLMLLAALPSLPMLGSWAYADMALVFYAAAALYSLASAQTLKSLPWLRMAGILAGFAMSVKYTSFTVPLACGLLILVWQRKSFGRALTEAAQFGSMALLVASLWYVRNLLLMGNPFYPFVFGGRYWDPFRDAWYTGAGTGIGWNPLQILSLPLSVVLGIRDQTFFDGRLGPIFLILAPFTLWILFSRAREDSEPGISLQAIGFFATITFVAWTVGVINSIYLWQARLLLPGVISLAIPTALGWEAIQAFDTSRFKISFFANAVILVVIGLTVFDHGIFVLQRNPLAVALGAQSRMGYMARVNPSYAGLTQIMEELPWDANVYSLFEPRSYGLPRQTQPDSINYNFSDLLYLYKTPDAIIRYLKAQHYTHILLYERGLNFLASETASPLTPAAHQALSETLAKLERVKQTPDGIYSIYRIP